MRIIESEFTTRFRNMTGTVTFIAPEVELNRNGKKSCISPPQKGEADVAVKIDDRYELPFFNHDIYICYELLELLETPMQRIKRKLTSGE